MYVLILGDWFGQSGRRLNGALQMRVEISAQQREALNDSSQKEYLLGVMVLY